MKTTKKPLRLLRIFDFNRDNEIDATAENQNPTLKRYFKILGRRLWKLISLNLMMLPMILPLLIAFYIYVSGDQTPTESTALFSQLYGANTIESTAASSLLLDLFGQQTYIPAYGVGIYVGIGICLLFLAVTFGWQNVGITYILRSMVRGEPVFLFSDYFYAIKRNFKQGFLLGLLDFTVLGLLYFDIQYFWSRGGTFILDVGFYAIMALTILVFFMRFYIYLMLVTFDLSIRKILKNALIFTTLGFKRNFMGLLGILLWTAVLVVLIAILLPIAPGIAVPLAIILPGIYYFSFCSFSSAYAAYPIIDRYMIAPYRTGNDYKDHPEANESESEVLETEAQPRSSSSDTVTGS